MRKVPFIDGEYYHIYNRGVDKRAIVSDQYDVSRFIQSMEEFNTLDPIGSIHEKSFNELGGRTPKWIVLIVWYNFSNGNNGYYFLYLRFLVRCDNRQFFKRSSLSTRYRCFHNTRSVDMFFVRENARLV